MNNILNENNDFGMDAFISKAPSDVPMSDYLKEKAVFFARVILGGKHYYLPISRALKKLLGLKVKNGEVIVPERLQYDLMDSLRSLVDAVYLQVRDTVGNEISSGLSDELQKGLAEVFEKNLSSEVFRRLDKGMDVKQIEHKQKE